MSEDNYAMPGIPPELQLHLPVRASNGGLFLSRGIGRHPDRIIDSYELIYVRTGCLAIGEAGAVYELAAGEALILYPGRRHCGLADYPADLSFYWIHFYLNGRRPPAAADDFPGDSADTDPAGLPVPKRCRVDDPEALTELCRAFLSQLESGERVRFRLDLLLTRILSELAVADTPAAPDALSHFACQADLYIRTHFHRKISTRDIACQVGCNEDYLGRIFRQAYGLTLTEAICRHRLQLACSRLLDGAGNIAEIAREVGFEDPGYFRRVFRQAKGMSPTQFRRRFSPAHINAV